MKICNTDEQYSCYKLDNDYYILYLGIDKDSSYTDLSIIKNSFEYLSDFVNKRFTDIGAKADKMFLIDSYKDFIHLRLGQVKRYYFLDDLQFVKPFDSYNEKSLMLDYKVRKVNIDKERIRLWLAKNRMLGNLNEVFIDVDNIIDMNKEYLKEFKCTEKELVSAQKYYMRSAFIQSYVLEDRVHIYKDAKYLYYVTGIRNLYDKISIKADKLTKVKLYFSAKRTFDSLHLDYNEFEFKNKEMVYQYEDL